jgi:uncharacterized protein YndB with AHSA1/START domain
VTPDRGRTVEVQHRVDGSPEAVFAYFTDPEKYRRWQGVEVDLDPRPGGVYAVALAPEVWVRGEYLAVEPPHRLVFSWGVESSIGLPRCFQGVPPGSSMVEVRILPDGDGTIIRVRHMGLPDEEASWGTGVGWDGYLPRLVAILGGDEPGEDPFMELSATLFAPDVES